jgi:hypothetical protein
MAKNRLSCFFPINSSEQLDLFVAWMVQIFQADPFLDPLTFDQLTQDIHTICFSFLFQIRIWALALQEEGSDNAAGQTYFGQTYYPKNFRVSFERDLNFWVCFESQ